MDDKPRREKFYGDEPLPYVSVRSSDLLRYGSHITLVLMVIRELSRSSFNGEVFGTTAQIAAMLRCTPDEVVMLSEQPHTLALAVVKSDDGNYLVQSMAAKTACGKYRNWVLSRANTLRRLPELGKNPDAAKLAFSEARARALSGKAQALTEQARKYASSANALKARLLSEKGDSPQQ